MSLATIGKALRRDVNDRVVRRGPRREGRPTVLSRCEASSVRLSLSTLIRSCYRTRPPTNTQQLNSTVNHIKRSLLRLDRRVTTRSAPTARPLTINIYYGIQQTVERNELKQHVTSTKRQIDATRDTELKLKTMHAVTTNVRLSPSAKYF